MVRIKIFFNTITFQYLLSDYFKTISSLQQFHDESVKNEIYFTF